MFNYTAILYVLLVLSSKCFSLSSGFEKINETYQSLKDPYTCGNSDGNLRNCKFIESCTSVQYDFNSYNFQPRLCGFHDKTGKPIVCCNDINRLMQPIKYSRRTGQKISKIKCLEYIAEIQRKIKLSIELDSPEFYCLGGKCIKIPPEMNMYSSAKTVYDEFPHSARIGWEKKLMTNVYDYLCGGSIISEKFVLTAAHCTYSENPQYKWKEPTAVQIGDSIRSIHLIESIIIHQEYKMPLKYNDIALIKLIKEIDFSDIIYPGCLRSDPLSAGTAIGIGWGEMDQNQTLPSRLRKSNLNLVMFDECKKNYPPSRTIPYGIAVSQFCAGNRVGHGDSCQGDSGGSIQLPYTVLDRMMYEIIGITSFGEGCGTNKGGVYTRVSHYIDWIERIVWPEEFQTITYYG